MNASPKSVAIFSASFTAAATASGNVDTLGYDFAVVDLIESASNAATNNCSVLKISESDDATTFVDVSGLVGDTDFTIPASVTTGVQSVVQMRIDLRGRKRYLKLSASPVTTQVLTGFAHLHIGE
ncbi:MAG TPA: hypothetical protein VMX97_15920, partial [Hyphomicrobiaceae bacterium]|nr:hypothetical protein [Hyphomicrobiaceae bacterium]